MAGCGLALVSRDSDHPAAKATGHLRRRFSQKRAIAGIRRLPRVKERDVTIRHPSRGVNASDSLVGARSSAHPTGGYSRSAGKTGQFRPRIPEAQKKGAIAAQ